MENTREIAGFSSNSLPGNGNGAQTLNVLPSTWEAFRAGMQILHRYSSHSPLGFHAVAKSNLLLLHRTLSCDVQYNNNIENLQREARKSGLPTISRLYTNKELTADLLIIQDGVRINLSALPHCNTMYLLISGSAYYNNAANDEDSSTRHWWERISSDGHKKKLRSGAVIISSCKHKTNQITARGKKCVLLKVHTPAIEIPWRIAS